ncbi:hypothetical protein ABBQ32_012008 [Trebouxia sp. C0010 RCD-2024]
MRSHTFANLAASPPWFLQPLRVVNRVDITVLQHVETSAMADDAGLKLHNELSHCLGSVARLWLSHSLPAYSLIKRPVMASLLGMLAAAGVTDGLTVQLALACSLLHMLALPLLVAYVAYTKLYTLQLHYTLLMWRLMRGNRDALAVLRRQYVFEASPRKQDHKHHDLTATDAPALEQAP